MGSGMTSDFRLVLKGGGGSRAPSAFSFLQTLAKGEFTLSQLLGQAQTD